MSNNRDQGRSGAGPLSIFLAVVPVLSMLGALLWNTAQAARKQEEMIAAVTEIKVWMASKDERLTSIVMDQRTLALEKKRVDDQQDYRLDRLEQNAGLQIPVRK